MEEQLKRGDRQLLIACALGFWGLWYAAYRGYYALGGTEWIPGTVLSATDFRSINAIAAVLLLAAAVLPVVAVKSWKRPVVQRILLVVLWIGAVGCVTHAVVDVVQQVMGLNGLLVVHVDQAMLRLDRRAAAFQDIFLNEPWFLLEGLLFAALALVSVRGRAASWWLVTAIAATVILIPLGVLTALGVLHRVIIG